MYYGLLALLTRALRQDARQLRNHLFRLVFVCFIYFFLLLTTFEAASRGAPGLYFFYYIAWLNAFSITCAGISFFSSAITEEKEENTIGLLQMAGLNHLGILLGKSTNRLIVVILLLIVQFPFMLLSVTLGGVTTHQLVAAYIDLIAYTVLLANVALVCSVSFDRGGRAAACTALLVIFHALTAYGAKLELSELTTMGWTSGVWWQRIILTILDWMKDSCLLYELDAVMQTGFSKPLLTRQVISNLVTGLLAFGLSWWLFGPIVNNSSHDSSQRGILVKSTSRIKMFSPGRCWNNPLLWKDFQFIGGGYAYFVIKLGFYLTVFAVMVAISTYNRNLMGFDFTDISQMYIVFMSVALILEACASATRIFHDEIRLQTMSSLLMLPRSIPYVGYSKALGCLLGLLPATMCLVGAILMQQNVGLERALLVLIDARLWAAIMTLLIFLHLIVLLSLFVKWGALPAAALMIGPITTCCPVWQLLWVVVGPNGGGEDVLARLPATITVWILTGLVCFVFQMMIAARLQELGTR